MCLENVLTRYLDCLTATGTAACECSNFIATCPTLNWFKCQAQENPVALQTHINACSFLSHFVQLLDVILAPPGGTVASEIQTFLLMGYSQVEVFLSLTWPTPSPIIGAQPSKPRPQARGSLRPQKEAPPHPLGLAVPQVQNYCGDYARPQACSHGASGWPWLYLSDKETRRGAQGQTSWTREECWLRTTGQLLLKDKTTSTLV